MKALTLWQPWASAIAIGAKTIETRGWRTNHRGPLLIHAAKSRSSKRHVAGWIETLALDLRIEHVPFGALIAVAELVACRPTESLDVTAQEDLLGDFTPGRFGWVLANIRAFKEPVPHTGRQQLFDVRIEMVAHALRAVGRADLIQPDPLPPAA